MPLTKKEKELLMNEIILGESLQVKGTEELFFSLSKIQRIVESFTKQGGDDNEAT